MSPSDYRTADPDGLLSRLNRLESKLEVIGEEIDFERDHREKAEHILRDMCEALGDRETANPLGLAKDIQNKLRQAESLISQLQQRDRATRKSQFALQARYKELLAGLAHPNENWEQDINAFHEVALDRISELLLKLD